MGFYGSEATILTEILKPILPDITGQHLFYYMSNVYGSNTLVYGYIYYVYC